jgi:Flp pilus assembly protein TadG
MKTISNQQCQSMTGARSLDLDATKRVRILDRLRAFLFSDREGNTLVEFALVAPVLLVLLTAMFSASMAIYSYERLGEAVFAGSQYLQNGRGLLSNSDPCLSAAQAVVANLPSFTGTFTYTVTFWTAPGTSVTYGPFSGAGTAGASCTGTAYNVDMVQNEPAQLTVTYQYVWFPVFGRTLGTGTLSKSETVLVE